MSYKIDSGARIVENINSRIFKLLTKLVSKMELGGSEGYNPMPRFRNTIRSISKQSAPG